jgi:hypothetical protein
MPRLDRASERAGAEALARIAKEIGRLDAWSFWSVPAEDHIVVAGTTGVFLVVPEVRDGALEVRGRRALIGGEEVRMRPARAAARRLRNRLGTGAVGVDIEPVLCLIRAVSGGPRSVRGVRIVGVDALAAEIARREQVLPAARAQRVVRSLGMTVAGDHKRHAAALRRRAG